MKELSDIETENRILHQLIFKKDIDVRDLSIGEDSFYNLDNKIIYKSILLLTSENKHIDDTTVLYKGKEIGLENNLAVKNIQNSPNELDLPIEDYIEILNQLKLRRDIVNICDSNKKNAINFTKEIYQVKDQMQESLLLSGDIYSNSNTLNAEHVTLEVLKDAEKACESLTGIIGLQTGIEEFDRTIKGLQEPDLIIIAGRPGMGKSSLAHTFMYSLSVEQRIPTGLFTLEMSSKQVGRVLMSQHFGIPHNKFSDGTLTKQEWDLVTKGFSTVHTAPIFFNDSSQLDVIKFKKISRQWVTKGVKAIFVDYLQLMSGTKLDSSREQEISTISRSLKACAKELKVPIIALAQLSRAVESRADKKPNLSDLRESGAIEQDADIVIFTWRPEYYKIEFDGDNNAYEKGYTEAIISKNRHGRLTAIPMKFDGSIKKFYNSSHIIK